MKLIYTLTLLLFTITITAQSNSLRINPNIILPKDSVESKALTNSLNAFLIAAQQPNEENRFIFESEKLETYIQLDEIKDVEKSGKFKDDIFYKPYLTNVIPLKSNKYIVTVSYIGINEGMAMLRASFEIIAHKAGNAFSFSSPLSRNTEFWKIEKAGNHIFHYKNSINKEKVKEFHKLASLFDAKLKVTNTVTDHYCTDNVIELQKLIGVDYKSDYNGTAESVSSSSLGNRQLVVLGNNNATFNEFDRHDLFHDRLGLVIARSKVNKPVDEGCAYLYGGSWGLTWKEIFKAFKEQIANNKNTSWTEVKETPVYFKTIGFRNSADYIINALLVKKIEKEKGFAGVWELLNVGPFEKGNEKYYRALEKLTGITKATYNEKVWELIQSEDQTL